MGARKKISAEKRKEALKTMYFAQSCNSPAIAASSTFRP